MKRRIAAGVLVAVAVVGVSLFYWQRQAMAVVFPMICTPAFEALDGRCMNQSYFGGGDYNNNTGESVLGQQGNALGSNNYYDYTDSLGSDGQNIYDIPPNIDNGNPNAANNFVNFIHAYLFNQTFAPDTTAVPGCSFPASITAPSTAWTIASSKPCDPYRSRAIGAAFLVLNMLGGKYNQYSVGPLFAAGPYANPVQNGVYDAQQAFPTWSAEVLTQAAAGHIVWNQIVSFPANHPNTQASDYTHDIQMFQQTAEIRHSIVFNLPSGQYIINRRCGNSVAFAALPAAPDMNMQTSVGGLLDASGNPVTQFTPGGTYTIHPSVSNTGNATSNTVYLELKTPNNTGNVSVNAPDVPYGLASGYSAVNNCAPGYPAATVSGSPPGACAGPHWWWEYHNIPAPSPLLQQVVTFSVSPGAAIGSNICFQSDVVHEYSLDPTSYAVSPVICYTVASPRYPSVIGLNGDIHAGGGLCDGTLSTGDVEGNIGANSYGQYVVSAAGAPISNFGSNGSGTSTLLNLGADGGYSQICREDIYKDADDYITTGGAVSAAYGPGSYDISGWTKIVHVTGTVNLLRRQCSNQTTVVETNPAATVYFGGGTCIANGGNTTLTGAKAAANALPSLSVITAGNIAIAASTTRVNAYMFCRQYYRHL